MFLCSLGWLRLLHQCLSVSTLNTNLAVEVLNSAASVEGLVEACCNLLLLPAPSLFTPNLERVLLQLGLHSRELGLRLIGLLLNNRSTPFFQGIALFSVYCKWNQGWPYRQIRRSSWVLRFKEVQSYQWNLNKSIKYYEERKKLFFVVCNVFQCLF